MKTNIKSVIRMVALAAIMFGQTVMASAQDQDLRIEISRTDNQAGLISWPAGEAGAVYRVMSSTNLLAWQGIATVQTNVFATAMTNGGARYFRIQKLSPGILTVSRYSGFGDQTLVAGTIGAQLGSFVIGAGAAQSINVSGIIVCLDPSEYISLTVDWLYLVDHATGALLSYAYNFLVGVNLYEVYITLPASGSKVIDLYGDIRSVPSNGTWQASIGVQGFGVDTGAQIRSGITPIQTITIAPAGSLTAARGSMPNSDILITGSTGNRVAQFAFSAAHEGFTVDELKLKVPFFFALSQAGIAIEYHDRNGAEQRAYSFFVTGSDTNSDAIATFTGLTMYVPNNANAWFDVDVDLTTIAQGAFSGAAGAITLLVNEGFSATGDSGEVVTSAGPADLTGNTFYVRKSKPTFAKQPLTGAPSTGNPLFRFSVVADNAGLIEIKQLSFLVSAVGCNVSGLYLYDPNANVRLTDIPVDPQNGIAVLPIGSVVATNYSRYASVVVIGTAPKVYEVRGVVAGYTASAGDSMTVGFILDTIAVPDGPASAMIGGGGWSVWSDRSSPTHSVYTTDWCNGYLLKDMGQVQTLP